MASLSISTALALSLLLFLLTMVAGQVNPGSFDISAEQGWNQFVQDAAKATGGTPIDMDDFITRVNSKLNDTGGEEPDPDLFKDLKNFNGKNDSSVSNPFGSETSSQPPAAGENVAKGKMIGSTINGGSLAPAPAVNGAMSVQIVGGLMVLLPTTVFASYFVL